MARIYYHEEKITGKAIDNKLINLKSFEHILETANATEYEISTTLKPSIFGLLSSKKELFRTAKISKDGIYYNASEGSFYLPEGIIFYDEDKYSFPEEFYFIARIKNQLEIRKCQGGKNVVWSQIPDLHQEVTDQKTISKIVHSFLELENEVIQSHKEELKIAQNNIKQLNISMSTPQAIRQEIANAYKTLVNACFNLHPQKNRVLDYIDTLKIDYTTDNDETIFNTFINFLEQENLPLIIRLDWKAGVEDLEWQMNTVLKNNFELSIALPKLDDYGENAIISDDPVLEDYENALQEHNLQMGIIDTECDEYLIVVHKITDRSEVEEAVINMGYDLDEV